jgi:hypothetical protein
VVVVVVVVFAVRALVGLLGVLLLIVAEEGRFDIDRALYMPVE